MSLAKVGLWGIWFANRVTSVTDLKVNEDLSPGALDFRLPEDALVIYSPPLSPTRQRVVLWGPDNLPRKEITNMHDIPGFEAALR
jgi:hypothetical protein